MQQSLHVSAHIFLSPPSLYQCTSGRLPVVSHRILSSAVLSAFMTLLCAIVAHLEMAIKNFILKQTHFQLEIAALHVFSTKNI